MCHQLGGEREAALTAAHRAAEPAEKFALLPWRASSLVLKGWATAVGAGVAEAARLIDGEIDKATAAARCRNIISVWRQRCCSPRAGPGTASRTLTAPSHGR